MEVEFQGKYIKIKSIPQPAGKKTKAWQVTSMDDSLLGIIKWYGPWRQYCHFVYGEIFKNPKDYIVLAPSCQDDITNFCREQTKKHKKP